MGSEMFLINWFKGNLFQELMERIQSHFELWQAPPRLYLCEVKEDPVIFRLIFLNCDKLHQDSTCVKSKKIQLFLRLISMRLRRIGSTHKSIFIVVDQSWFV